MAQGPANRRHDPRTPTRPRAAIRIGRAARGLLGALALLVPLFGALAPAAAATATDTQCTTASLQADVNSSGSVQLDCPDGISLTSTVAVGSGATVVLTVYGSTYIAGNGQGIFSVPSGSSLTLDGPGLTLTGGASASGGGAILNNGSLTVQDVVFQGDTSSSNGGAILNDGTASVSGSTFTGDSASSSGGAIANAGTSSDAALTLDQDAFSGDTAGTSGGGAVASFSAQGYSATLQVTDSTFAGNTASGGSPGGAISNQAVVGGSAALAVTGSLFSGNSAAGDGGAIDDWTNTAYAGDQTTATIAGSLFLGNTAVQGQAGAVASEEPGTSVTVQASTFAGNRASAAGGALNAQAGGRLQLANSTLEGNAATNSNGEGGGLFVSQGGSAVLANDTLSGNAAPGGGDNLAVTGAGTATTASVENSIVAGAVYGQSCSSDGPSGGGTVVDDGYNLWWPGGDTSCGFQAASDVAGDPLLGALAANGGPLAGATALGSQWTAVLETMAPQAGSAAVGGGDATACQAAPVGGVDERGVARPAQQCDIGAYQTPLGPPVATGVQPVAAPAGGTITITGGGFGLTPGSVRFAENGTALAPSGTGPISWSTWSVAAAVPASASLGTVSVSVYNPLTGWSNAESLTVTTPPTATTLYVSTGGSDTSGDGSPTAPYATVAHALSVAPAGATVLVEPGTYDLQAPLSVTQAVYLESDALGGGTAANTILDAAGQPNGIVVSGAAAAGTVIDGLTVERAQKAGVVLAGTTGVTVADSVIQENDQSCAGFAGCNDPNSNNGLPAGAPGSDVPAGGTPFTATDGVPCGNPATGGSDCEALHLLATTASTIEGNTVQGNLDGGIYLTDETGPASGNLISANQVLDNQVDCGITLASHNPRAASDPAAGGVFDNTVTGNTTQNPQGAAGILLATPLPGGAVYGNSITGNTVEDNGQGGIVLHTHTPGAQVQDNVVGDNTLSGNGADPVAGTVQPAGIVLYGGGAAVSGTTIDGNTVTDEYYGIFQEHDAGSVLSGNTISVTAGGTAVFDAPYTLTLDAPVAVAEGAAVTVSGAVYDGGGTGLTGITVDLTSGGATLATAASGTGGAYSATFTAPGSAQALALKAAPAMGGGLQTAVVLVTPPGVSVSTSSTPIPTPPPSGSPVVAGGTGTDTPETSAAATGLTGTVNVADYSADPVPGAPLFAGAGTYFDVDVANAVLTASASLTIRQCAGVAAGDELLWFNSASGTWQPVSPAASFSGGCLTATLDAGSSPALSQLTGTPFAAGTPLVYGGGGGGGGGYAAPALPSVTGVSPASGPASGGTAVTITGTNFAAPATVDFGTNPATNVTVESPTDIQATSPAGSGTVHVTVTTASGTSATGTADEFTYAAPPVPPSAVSFSDVPSSFWAYQAIETLAGKGIVAGFPNGTFQPDAAVTRAQFVKMLVLTLGLKPGSGATSFTDVAPSDWFAPYVAAAVRAGIVAGLTPTRFGPDETLTREQLAVLLARALKLTRTATLRFTDDAAIDAWAAQGVQEAVAAGYVAGFPNGTFQPLAAATRAQAAKILALVLRKQPA